jgi:hypothetical protein
LHLIPSAKLAQRSKKVYMPKVNIENLKDTLTVHFWPDGRNSEIEKGGKVPAWCCHVGPNQLEGVGVAAKHHWKRCQIYATALLAMKVGKQTTGNCLFDESKSKSRQRRNTRLTACNETPPKKFNSGRFFR